MADLLRTGTLRSLDDIMGDSMTHTRVNPDGTHGRYIDYAIANHHLFAKARTVGKLMTDHPLIAYELGCVSGRDQERALQ